MKKQLLTIMLAATAASSWADMAIIDGINYYLGQDGAKKFAQVYPLDEGKYSGDVVIPDAVTYNGDEYPVTSIWDGSFYESDITSVSIPNTVTYIGRYCFQFCKQLESVVIPGSVTALADGAFAYCDNLKSMTLEYGTEMLTMREDLCYDSGLSEVYIDRDKIDSYGIGVDIFGSYGRIRRATFGPHVTTIPKLVLRDCRLEELTFEGDVTSIEDYAFFQATLPADFTLPKHLNHIGYDAFENCAMPATLVIPATVETIEPSAFVTSAITDVYVPWLSPLTFDEYSYRDDKLQFNFNNANLTLWVPGGTMDLYKGATLWERFKKMEYWSYVVSLDVVGPGTLTADNSLDITDNGTNTPLSATEEANTKGLMERGSTVTLTPEGTTEGYSLTSLTVNGVTMESPYTITDLQADAAIVATFGATVYTITYDLDGGHVESDNPTFYTIESEAITLNNPVRTGYEFTGWTGTGLDGPTMTVVIDSHSTGDRSYTATWQAITYSVTIEPMEHGTVIASTLTPAYGSDVTLTVVPDEGYRLESLVVNGVQVAGYQNTDDYQYVVERVKGDVTVGATFYSVTTGIADNREAGVFPARQQPVYDMQGRRMPTGKKGLAVSAGKKVLVQ